ncbi:hypothetical protein AB7M17_004224 [Bradyrhizobium sp. USDA 377]
MALPNHRPEGWAQPKLTGYLESQWEKSFAVFAHKRAPISARCPVAFFDQLAMGDAMAALKIFMVGVVFEMGALRHFMRRPYRLRVPAAGAPINWPRL